MKKALYLCLALIGAAAVLLAANFWDKKQPEEWKDKEIRSLLQSSPWAHSTNVAVGHGTIAPQPNDDPASRSLGNGGVGQGGGRGPGAGGGVLDDSGLNGPAVSMVIQWTSAMPVKQALIRSTMAEGEALSEESKQFLDRKEDYYVLAVVGVPAVMAQLSQGTDRFVESSRLERGKGKEPLKPERVEGRAQQNSVTLYYFFPRTDPITIEDNDVRFVFKLTNVEIKQKFKLKDMMFNGELAL